MAATGAAAVEEALPASESIAARWMLTPATPRPLALLRIGTMLGLLLTIYRAPPWNYENVPGQFADVSPYGGWIVDALPRGNLVNVGAAVMVVACVAGALGWRSRTSSAAAAVLGFWVLGQHQLYGFSGHYHHLIWFAALLAVVPCGDALALDARRKPRPEPSSLYGFPVRIAWLLLGLAYLSAAIPKLGYGISWALSDNLRNHMWQSWHQLELVPWFRLDQHPWLYKTAGLGALVFEVAFLPAMLWRRTRAVAAAVGVLFHVGVAATLGIRFWNMLLCYGVFAPGAEREGRRVEPKPAVVLVALTLLVGAAGATVTGRTDGWPFGAYPAFHRISDPVASHYEYRLDGAEIGHEAAEVGFHAWRFMMPAIARQPDLGDVLAEELGGDEWELVVETVSTDPDDKVLVDRRVVTG